MLPRIAGLEGKILSGTLGKSALWQGKRLRVRDALSGRGKQPPVKTSAELPRSCSKR